MIAGEGGSRAPGHVNGLSPRLKDGISIVEELHRERGVIAKSVGWSVRNGALIGRDVDVGIDESQATSCKDGGDVSELLEGRGEGPEEEFAVEVQKLFCWKVAGNVIVDRADGIFEVADLAAEDVGFGSRRELAEWFDLRIYRCG